MKGIARVLDSVRAREALLAVEQRRLARGLAPDTLCGERQREVPILMTEDDVLGVADASVEDVAIDQRAGITEIALRQ